MADLSMVFDLLARDRASSEVSKVGDSMDKAGDKAGGFGERVSGMFATLAAAAAGAGLAVGAGFMGALEAEATTSGLGASLGLDPAEAAAAGKMAGDLYAGNYGDSMETVQTAVDAVASSLTGLGPVGSEAMQTATRDALNFAAAFGVDTTEAVNTVGSLITQGLVPDAATGFDMMTAAYQQVPAAMRGELGPILDEYGTNFRALGFTGEQAFGLLTKAADGGAIVLDKTGDALKELTILVGSDLAATGPVLEGLGLKAEVMSDAIASGGPAAQSATREIAQALLDVEDPSDRAAQAVALFGTPLEDLSVDQIPSFLEAIANVGPGMTDTAGAADQLDATLGQGIGPRLETLKRQAQQAMSEGMTALLNGFTQGKTDAGGWQGALQNGAATLSDVLVPAVQGAWTWVDQNLTPALQWLGDKINDPVIPALKDAHKWFEDNRAKIETVATVIGVVLLPALGRLAFAAIASGASTLAGWAMSVAGAIGAGIVYVAQSALIVARWVIMGAAAIVQGAVMAVAWVVGIIGPAVVAGAIMLAQSALMVGKWILMGAVAMGQAVIMAAAWFIALGPIGWAIAAIIAIVAIVVLNWEKIKTFTIEAWNTITSKLSGAWDSITGSISSGITTAVEFVRGLPGKILGAIGNFGQLLYDSGADMIQGLIDGAGSLLRNIGRFFLNLVPSWIRGPFESALGISSPSKVFHAYGRNIGQGLVDGITGMQPAVEDAVSHLVPTGVDLVRMGDVSEQVWDQLRAEGWKGRAGDRMEALYRPAAAPTGYRAPTYDMPAGGGGAGGGGASRTVNVSGVVGPEQVAAIVRREQQVDEFLAGAGL